MMITHKEATMVEFTAEPFEPHPLLRNPHMQTVAGEYFRRFKSLPFRRIRLETPDDDFLDVDFAEVPNYTWDMLGDDAPILFMLHGLEGDARRGYAIDLYLAAAQAGFRCVGINHRSCSGEMNRQPRFYHMGATEDLRLVHEWLVEQFPNAPMVMVGVSLGGNMLLKYLGERGTDLPSQVIAGAAVSPVLVATGKQKINEDRIGRLYGRYLLKSLQAKVRLKLDILKDSAADPVRALKASTLLEFDEAITAPLHGFRDADDYYAKSQSFNFLGDIQIPTLILRALDDPFFSRNIPYETIEANNCLHAVFTEHGGHVGFMEGTTPFNYRNWAERQTFRFFEAVQDSLSQKA
jgi:uncharacterized protein